MMLTPAQRRDLAQLIEEELRTFGAAARVGADPARAAHHRRAFEAAQRRLADGTYGTCSACGRDIEMDRLVAYPAAARCLDCQAIHERHGPGADDAEN
jgi:RNA polymerase-binding transcription factor DksA